MKIKPPTCITLRQLPRPRYIPLTGAAGVLGILGVKPADADRIITPKLDWILTAFANQLSLALKWVRLTKKIP